MQRLSAENDELTEELREEQPPGSWMVISDHLNLTGLHPGCKLDDGCFVKLAEVEYDEAFHAQALDHYQPWQISGARGR